MFILELRTFQKRFAESIVDGGVVLQTRMYSELLGYKLPVEPKDACVEHIHPWSVSKLSYRRCIRKWMVSHK